MENKKLSWAEIEKLYDQQWVELIDFDWPEDEPLPKSGVVRVHAKTRKEFDRLAADNAPTNSAYVYVGRRELPPNTFLNTFRVLEVS